MPATRHTMATPDKILAIDAPATAEGARFLAAYRRRDSGVKVPRGNAHERRIAATLLDGRPDLADELLLDAEVQGWFVNLNVVEALVLLGRATS